MSQSVAEARAANAARYRRIAEALGPRADVIPAVGSRTAPDASRTAPTDPARAKAFRAQLALLRAARACPYRGIGAAPCGCQFRCWAGYGDQGNGKLTDERQCCRCLLERLAWRREDVPLSPSPS